MKNGKQDLSVLGFGCMRLPVTQECKVDRPEAIRMIRHGIDQGINYYDTAYVYHGGESEVVLGQALRDGYREKVNVATKLPTWLVEKREDMDRYLDEQLARLQTDHIDFYLIHGLGKARWQQIGDLGVKDFLDDALADGRICYAGFSFHDKGDTFADIVDGYRWTFAQIQYNYMDEDYQAGKAGLQYAAAKGLDVMIMEPLRGGMLTSNVPEIEKMWAESRTKKSPAERGLQWVWNHPEVTCVLSGMNTMDQLNENLQYAERALPGKLTEHELTLYGRVKAAYRERTKIDCTKCEYCKPCPCGVDIPGCFEVYNNVFMYNDDTTSRQAYLNFMSDVCASKCSECGECEEKCPQALPIRENLKKVKELFGQ